MGNSNQVDIWLFYRLEGIDNLKVGLFTKKLIEGLRGEKLVILKSEVNKSSLLNMYTLLCLIIFCQIELIRYATKLLAGLKVI